MATIFKEESITKHYYFDNGISFYLVNCGFVKTIDCYPNSPCGNLKKM